MMLRKLSQLPAMLAFLACSGVAAQAAGDKGTNASPLTQPPSQPANPAASDASQGYLFDLRPIGSNLGAELASHGVYITGRTINEGLGNASGGLKHGAFYEGYTSLGVDLDMDRILGIKGGSFHVLVDDLNGANYFPYSGSLYTYNRIWAYTPAARLNEFSYEQNLFNGNLDLRVGRIPVGSEFDFSKVYCEFLNGICATPAAYTFNKGYPAYLTSSWAGVAQIKLPSSMYLNVGIYEDEPSMATQHHFNWPGEDWSFDKGTGVTIPVQLGYRTNFKTDPYPRAFSIGAFYDTQNYNDPLLNTNGVNRILYGGTAKTDVGKSHVWVQAEQMVWRPDFTSDRGLTLFAGGNFTPSGQPNIQTAFFAGLSMKGLYEARPNDTINLMGQALIFNQNYVNAVNSNMRLRGIYESMNPTEYEIELNYGLAVAPGITFKPFLNYIINPDQVGLARPSATNTHTLFVGAAISAFFPESLGLPRLKVGL